MSRPIELTLENLIPRHSGALPRQLVELASSLLAQSRNKCSNLKAEEEAARLYACANLACERLKTSLNLPPIESRPPIPPRAYTRLYKYFDNTLQTSSARARAQQKSARSTPSKSLPQRGTPSKEQSFKSFSNTTPSKSTLTPATTSYRTPKKGLKYSSKSDNENKIPKWVVPSIRFLCKEMGTPKAIPHINAGVESLLTLPCPKPDVEAVIMEEKGNGKIPALIASIWYFVVIKMRGKEGVGVETKNRQEMARDVLGRVREEEWVTGRVGEGEEGWKGWEVVGVKDVMAWNMEIALRGWKEMDWFSNVPDGGGVEGEVEVEDLEEVVEEDVHNEVDDEDESVFIGRRGIKSGRMYQKKYDYLSAKNRTEYKRWKEGILAMMADIRSKDNGKDTVMTDV